MRTQRSALGRRWGRGSTTSEEPAWAALSRAPPAAQREPAWPGPQLYAPPNCHVGITKDASRAAAFQT